MPHRTTRGDVDDDDDDDDAATAAPSASSTAAAFQLPSGFENALESNLSLGLSLLRRLKVLPRHFPAFSNGGRVCQAL